MRLLSRLGVILGLSLAACADRELAGDEAAFEELEPGDQPAANAGMYSPCTVSEDCPDGLTCVYPEGEAGYCSGPCAAPDDPGGCAEPPGDQPPTCFDIGLPAWACALDCADAPCPRGMRCEQVMASDGARSICF